MHYLFRLINYFQYLQQARNKFDVHPPFIYELINNVLDDRQLYSDYLVVERLKSVLLKDNDLVDVNDLGAGSATGSHPVRTVSNITRYSSKSKKYGRLLFRLSRHFRPETLLELGTAMGISAAYLAMGNQNAMLTTIEGCSNIAGRAKLNIKSIGLQNIQIINGSFDEILPVYLNSIDRLDLAFIDGNHKEIPTINYFEQCLLKSVNTSCFIFDDIHWSKEMENAWSYIVKHEVVTLSIDLYSMGIVFFRKELSKQHFIIRF